jgi:hypothetical protein
MLIYKYINMTSKNFMDLHVKATILVFELLGRVPLKLSQ